jgi:hypothetical protein
VKKRGDRSHTRGARGGSPGCGKVLQVLIALVLVVSCIWRERATLPLGVHPLAVGHPPGSGLGPVLADGERMNPYLNQTLTVPLCTFRSILEPEAPPEATKKRYRLSAFQAGHIPRWHGSCERYALSLVAAGCRWSLLLLSRLLSAAIGRTDVSVTACTLQGMARVRFGQARAWPLVADRRGCSGSAVRGGQKPFPKETQRALDGGGASPHTKRTIPGP